VRFTAYTNRSGTVCNVKIHLEDDANPTRPTNRTDLLGRSLDSGTAWNSLPAWSDGTTYDSPDIASQVQDIIDKTGWAANNSMSVHMRDNGSDYGAFRTASARDHSTAEDAVLYITYLY
jgi:hypothetical protein